VQKGKDNSKRRVRNDSSNSSESSSSRRNNAKKSKIDAKTDTNVMMYMKGVAFDLAKKANQP